MGILGDAIHRNGAGAAPGPDVSAGPVSAPQPSPAPQPPAGSPAQPDARSELQRRRDRLAEQVTELHWDLGGLAYEMAIRDHFRLDVLVRRAALLQECDAELAEVERLLRMEDQAMAGQCPHCAAPHSRGAPYCWQCGATLIERAQDTAVGDSEGTANALDQLLSGHGAPGQNVVGPDA